MEKVGFLALALLLYGRVSDGGLIQHITYPDQFMTQKFFRIRLNLN